jgi:2-desacetyl-2-hydroxyethyl bacteriochlorophyllide A dehydrogenase
MREQPVRAIIARVRRLLGWLALRWIPEADPSTVVPFVRRWATARAKALMRLRGLVRATVVACPQPGRLLTIEQDVAGPSRGEVLVRVEVSAVSPGTERAFFKRLPNARPTYPYFPGYSLAGEVAAVGRGSSFRPGDRVAAAAPHASVAVVHESQVYPVPAEVSLEEAAFVQLGIIALQAIQKAHLHPGASMVVLGQGLIGQLLVQLGAAQGADPIYSVALTSRRLSDALRQTAHQVVVLDRDGHGLLDHLHAEVVFDATGSPDGVPAALRCAAEGGRVVLVGSTRGATERADFGQMADRAVSIVGAHINSCSRAEMAMHARIFFDLLRHRRLDITSLISDRVHPWEAEWFYRRLAGRNDATVGAVMCWNRLEPPRRLRRVSYFTPPDLMPFRHMRMVRWPLGRRLLPGSVRP